MSRPCVLIRATACALHCYCWARLDPRLDDLLDGSCCAVTPKPNPPDCAFGPFGWRETPCGRSQEFVAVRGVARRGGLPPEPPPLLLLGMFGMFEMFGMFPMLEMLAEPARDAGRPDVTDDGRGDVIAMRATPSRNVSESAEEADDEAVLFLGAGASSP